MAVDHGLHFFGIHFQSANVDDAVFPSEEVATFPAPVDYAPVSTKPSSSAKGPLFPSR